MKDYVIRKTFQCSKCKRNFWVECEEENTTFQASCPYKDCKEKDNSFYKPELGQDVKMPRDWIRGCWVRKG